MSLTKDILEWRDRQDQRKLRVFGDNKSHLFSQEWYQDIINGYQDKLRTVDEEIERRASANK